MKFGSIDEAALSYAEVKALATGKYRKALPDADHSLKRKASGIDDSEAIQTARKAKKLLDKLAEYKPLAKVEELEEQNYNMIDNVLNNGAEKKEQEQTKGRISVREKLAEKKAVIEQRDKVERTLPEKEAEKKSQREM